MVATTNDRCLSEVTPRTPNGTSKGASDAAPIQAVLQRVQPEMEPQSMKQQPDEDFNLMMRGLLHELRNPLSSILTAANLVEDTARNRDDDDETAMLLGVIKKESLRLNRILTEFANFIKLPEPRPTAFDIVQLTRDVVSQLQDEKILAGGVGIDDQLPGEYFVRADQNQMRTALHHLLRNAGEAMPEAGKLCLSLEEHEGDAVLCMGDNGAGFSEESRKRAFQPFYSTKVHGIGLGLSAARAIIEAVDGRLWIDSDGSNSSAANASAAPANAASAPRVRVCVQLPRAEAGRSGDETGDAEYSSKPKL